MQNMVVADRAGRIGVVSPGRVPVRQADNDLHGLVPAPGWEARYDWAGWVPSTRPRASPIPGAAGSPPPTSAYGAGLSALHHQRVGAGRIASSASSSCCRHGPGTPIDDLAAMQADEKSLAALAAAAVLGRPRRPTRWLPRRGRCCRTSTARWRPTAPHADLLAWQRQLARASSRRCRRGAVGSVAGHAQLPGRAGGRARPRRRELVRRPWHGGDRELCRPERRRADPRARRTAGALRRRPVDVALGPGPPGALRARPFSRVKALARWFELRVPVAATRTPSTWTRRPASRRHHRRALPERAWPEPACAVRPGRPGAVALRALDGSERHPSSSPLFSSFVQPWRRCGSCRCGRAVHRAGAGDPARCLMA